MAHTVIPGLVRWGEEGQEFKVIMSYTEEFRVRLLGEEKKKPLKVRSHKAFCVPSNTHAPPPFSSTIHEERSLFLRMWPTHSFCIEIGVSIIPRSRLGADFGSLIACFLVYETERGVPSKPDCQESN